jgi:hypothetical protein
MPEPTDAVLPILRRIQTDLAETRRELGRKIDTNTAALADHGERLVSIEGYLIYELGLTTRAKADIQAIQAEVKAIKKRIAVLERSSPKGRSK